MKRWHAFAGVMVWAACAMGVADALAGPALNPDAAENRGWDKADDKAEYVWLAQPGSACAMSLNKAELTHVSLQLETDAKELILHSGTAAAIRIAAAAPPAAPAPANPSDTNPPAKAGTRSIDFALVGDRPTLRIDGAEGAQWRGQWIALMRDAAPQVRLELRGASYATVTITGGDEGSSAQTASADGETSVRIADIKTADKAALVRVAASVVQVRANDEKGALGTASGFIVSNDGLVATTFRAVQGAMSATASIGEGGKPVPVELAWADPALDVALLRLPAGQYPSLTIAPAEPPVGTAVYAVGHEPEGGPSASAGATAAVQMAGQLPEEVAAAFKRAQIGDGSRVLSVSRAVVDAHGAGGPVVDARGNVIGMGILAPAVSAEGAEPTSYAIAGRHVADVVRQAAGKSAIGFKQAAMRFKDRWNDRVDEVGGIPRIVIKPTGTPQQLAVATKTFADGIEQPCVKCKGKGRVTVRKRIGTRRNGPYNEPVFANVDEQCAKCTGKGKTYAQGEVLGRLSDTFVRSVASLNIDAPQASDSLRKAYESVVSRVISNHRGWTELNKRGRGIIAQRRIEPGTPVIVRARIWGTMSQLSGNQNDRMMVGEVSGTDQMLCFANPQTADEVKNGGRVLAGGIVAGITKTKDGKSVVVLQNGFVISPNVDQSYYWWYD